MKQEITWRTHTQKKNLTKGDDNKLQSGDSSLAINIKVDLGSPFSYMPQSIGGNYQPPTFRSSSFGMDQFSQSPG